MGSLEPNGPLPHPSFTHFDINCKLGVKGYSSSIAASLVISPPPSSHQLFLHQLPLHQLPFHQLSRSHAIKTKVFSQPSPFKMSSTFTVTTYGLSQELNFAALPPREAPWRRAPGLEPHYTFDLGSVISFHQDMCTWQLFHRPEFKDHNLWDVAMNAVMRYFEGIPYTKRREILSQAIRDGDQAESQVRKSYNNLFSYVRRLEVMEERNEFIPAGGTYPLLNLARS
jgi:hypothetical protein